MQGFVKKVTRDHAFGFIRAEDGVDYFFHQSAVEGAPPDAVMHEGVVVRFEPVVADKGPKAVHIHMAA